MTSYTDYRVIHVADLRYLPDAHSKIVGSLRTGESVRINKYDDTGAWGRTLFGLWVNMNDLRLG